MRIASFTPKRLEMREMVRLTRAGDDRLVPKEYWDKHWLLEEKFHPDRYLFDRLLRRFLPHGGRYFEVGCAPGTTMAYFQRKFDYDVTGIDYSSGDQVRKTMARYAIADYTLIEEDFLTYRTAERYDVVGSFGFVEHFRDYGEVLRLQARLVRPGGYILVEVPNLRYVNWLLYRLFLPGQLRLHNLAVMQPRVMLDGIRAEADFTPLYASYHGTSILQSDPQNPVLRKHPLMRVAAAAASGSLELLHLDNVPSRFLSPYIIVIARRLG